MASGARLRFQTSHVKFAVAFPALLYGVCNALNIDKLARWFPHKGGVDYLALSAYLLAGLGVFIVFFTLLAHRRTVKPLAILLVMVSTAATYFIAKYDVAIDSSMVMNTLHTDSTEVRQLLSLQMLPYVALLMVLPVLVILSTEITFQPARRYLVASSKLIAIALAVSIGLLYLNYNAIHLAGNVSKKYIVYSLVPINVLSGSLSVASKSIAPYIAREKREVAITGRVRSNDSLLVVLAIGESARKSNFSLYGYRRRNTNPVLQRFDGLHLLNGIARRGSTLYALPEILEKADVKLPRIVSQLGIPTSCYVNYTLYDNCAAVGEIPVSHCAHGGKCYDEDLIPLLEESLRTYTSGKRFVVLHLGGGSHGPDYGGRIPPEFHRLKPTCDDADVANQCTLEQIYNSYDNTILYTDYVLGEILQRLESSGAPYVFIYLSDHGESLMDEGRMFHGMPPGVTLPPEQAEIPLLVKASVPIAIVERPEYRQQEVFDTVLDLLSIETPILDSKAVFIKRVPSPLGVAPQARAR